MIAVTQLYLSEYIPGLQFREDALTEPQADRLFDVVCHAATEIFGIDNKTAVRLATIVRSICLKEDQPLETTYSEEEVLFTCSLQEMYAFGSFIRSVGKGIARGAVGTKTALQSISKSGALKLNQTANKINRLTGSGTKHLGATVNNRVNNNAGVFTRIKEGFKTGAEIQKAKQDNLNGLKSMTQRGQRIQTGQRLNQAKEKLENASQTNTNTTNQSQTDTSTSGSNSSKTSFKDRFNKFGEGFKDSNGIMGTKDGLKGMGNWVKNNKAQAATAAIGTAAAEYGTYRMLKPKKQQSQQNVTIVNKR